MKDLNALTRVRVAIEIKEDALIYIMANDILNLFGLSAEERKACIQIVKEKFENYFDPPCNVFFMSAKFSQPKLLPGETMDDFITDLHCLAD